MRRAGLIVMAVVVLFIPTSCSSGDGASSSAARPSTGGQSSEDSQSDLGGDPASPSTDPAEASLTDPGVLALSCDPQSAEASVQLLSPDDGSVIVDQPVELRIADDKALTICMPDLLGARHGGAAERAVLREQFNPDFTAVVWTGNTQEDGSGHVGFSALVDGTETDVTEATRPTGFGALPPVDSRPVFDPDTGDFVFMRALEERGNSGTTFEIHRFDTATSKDKVIGKIDTTTCAACRDSRDISIQHGIVVLGDNAVSADGKTAAGSQYGGVTVRPIVGPIFDDPDPVGNATDSRLSGSYVADTTRVSVMDWIDGSTVLAAITDGSADLFGIPVSPTGVNDVAASALLPANTSEDSNAIVSPDGTKVLFTARQDQTFALYKTSSRTQETPETISANFADTSAPIQLLAWQ